MLEGPITFDRAARWIIVVLGIACAYFVLDYLHAVLLPFFVAWLFAYLLNPLVNFIQHKMKVKVRAIAILLAMIAVIAVLSGVLLLIIPPMIEEFGKFSKMVLNYLHNVTMISNFPGTLKLWIYHHQDKVEQFLTSEDFTSSLKGAAPKVITVAEELFTQVGKLLESFITLLYMFFILLDYDKLSKDWVKIFPKESRPFCQELMHDVERALNSYIRGQGLVALTMGILFIIGLSIIGFPMAIGLGILIGILDMIPYLHTFALIPAGFLAAMKAAETGQSFWVVFGSVLAVFAIVQIIIESIVNPKIMGKQMGMNPAVLLLSLSIWGALLGIIGLIIALPATTIIIDYYKRYVAER